jgi:hypothetical protein
MKKEAVVDLAGRDTIADPKKTRALEAALPWCRDGAPMELSCGLYRS